MPTELFWINGPWRGKLAIAPRPRGGDWLDDELAAWSSDKVSLVLSLLTDDETRDLSLEDEGNAASAAGIAFLSLPIEDRTAPATDSGAMKVVERLISHLKSGGNAVVHCRQGIGRAATLALAALLVSGDDLRQAISRVSTARGLSVPETDEQLAWLERLEATRMRRTA